MRTEQKKEREEGKKRNLSLVREGTKERSTKKGKKKGKTKSEGILKQMKLEKENRTFEARVRQN